VGRKKAWGEVLGSKGPGELNRERIGKDETQPENPKRYGHLTEKQPQTNKNEEGDTVETKGNGGLQKQLKKRGT